MVMCFFSNKSLQVKYKLTPVLNKYIPIAYYSKKKQLKNSSLE